MGDLLSVVIVFASGFVVGSCHGRWFNQALEGIGLWIAERIKQSIFRPR